MNQNAILMVEDMGSADHDVQILTDRVWHAQRGCVVVRCRPPVFPLWAGVVAMASPLEVSRNSPQVEHR